MDLVGLIFNDQTICVVFDADAALEKAIVSYISGYHNCTPACKNLVVAWGIDCHSRITVIIGIIIGMWLLFRSAAFSARETNED